MDWLDLLPEPSLVVSAEERILQTNERFRRLLGTNLLQDDRLGDLIANDGQDLRRRLRTWARSKQMVPGSLRLRSAEGELDLAVEAGRLSPATATDQPAAILIRCKLKQKSVERFRLLGEKIDALSREVMARKQAEQEAAEQRERLRVTLTSIGDGVITTDCNQNITFMNPAAERLTGWTAQQAKRQAFTDVFRIVNEETGEPAPDPCQEVVSKGHIVALTNNTALIARDGTRYIIEDSAAPIRDTDGTLQGVVVVFHDVTDRYEAERQIRAQQEWFRTTLASIGDAVIATDQDGNVVFMNPIAEKHTGWPLAEAQGRDSLEVFHIVNEDTRKPVESPVTRVIREGIIVGLANHTILIARDGTERPIDDSGAPIRDDAGNLAGTVLVFRDISQRRAAEQALRESERRFRTLADAAPVLVWMSDTTGGRTYFNRQWLAYTGRDLEQELGDGWAAGIHPDDHRRCLSTYRRAFDQREPFRMEYRLRRHDSEYRWLLDHGEPRHAPEGAFLGYIGSCIDITERRQAEQQLLSINDTLERRVEERTTQLRDLAQQLTRAEQKERRRLAQILHDNLQQLLAAARMRTDVMAQRIQNADIRATAHQVRDLIHQSIEASRSLTLELSPPVLYDGGLCAALPWLARQMREQHDIQVTVHVENEAEPQDEETRVSLFLAIRELLFNTAKHAQADNATVELSLSEEGWARVTVQDTGVGFDPDQITPSADDGGFGLFNVRERIVFLGGQMTIDSAPGQGTRIDIRMPRRGSTANTPPSVQATERRKQVNATTGSTARPTIRVLIADDHRMLREGIAGILADYPDIEIIAEAADGAEAVEFTRQHAPDMAIMDITMPKLSGIEATRLITEEMPAVVVIGLSMHDSPDMARAMTEAGAVQMLVKDGPTESLVEAIREAAKNRQE